MDSGDLTVSFGSVFFAEMGDKSQLLVLSMAVRYRLAQLIAVLVVVIAALQALSVSVGALVSTLLPQDVVGLVAGAMFVAFGVATLRTARAAGQPDAQQPAATDRSLLALGATFFVAELGDKTMLTTAGLAADRALVAVWIGSFGAMVAAMAVAVVAGRTMLRRLPPSVLHMVSAVVFLALGAATVAGVLLG